MLAGKHRIVVLLTLFVVLGVLVATPAMAQLLLDDSLQGSTSGTQGGGSFVSGGWQVTGDYDSIFWHLPYSVSYGAAEFYVTGIGNDYAHKTELWHQYDYTWNNADYQYAPGYQNDVYKSYIRKSGVLEGAKNNSCEILWQITTSDPENYVEGDTSVLSWNAGNNYKFRVEWGPSGSQSYHNVYRDDVLIIGETVVGNWAPAGHSVRIGCSTRRAGEGSEIGAKYSYLKVWDLTNNIPGAPSVNTPANGETLKSNLVFIKWAGDSHDRYQVRVCTADNPDTGIAWDSGQQLSSRNWAWTGALGNMTNYYVYVKLGSTSGWGGWSAAGRWFRVDSGYSGSNAVVLQGNTLRDNNGPFLGLGFTHMRSLHRCKYDRAQFQYDIGAMAGKGFKYQRILSMVAWTGLEIAPINMYNPASQFIPAWPDYWSQFDYDIDYAYDNYGIRTEVTIFADAQYCMPNDPDRYAHMDLVLAHCNARPEKIIQIEVANEAFQNGFNDVDTVRLFGQYLAARTSIPISNSSWDTTDAGMIAMNSGSGADIATAHLSRDLGSADGHWGPVIDSWRMANLYPGVPPVSSNEPIGTGSSVASEDHPNHLCAAGAFAWVANLPMYVYHCKAGIQGILNGNPVYFDQSLGFNAYQYLMQIIPPDVASWIRNDGKESSSPFTAYSNGQANKYWTDVPGATSGCHRNIGGRKGIEFICFTQGVLGGGVILEARQQVTFRVYDALNGSLIMDVTTKNTGEQINLSQGNEVYIIKGAYGPSLPTPGGGSKTLNSLGPRTLTIDGSSSDWNLSEYTTLVRGGQGGIGDTGLVGFDGGNLYYGSYAGVLPTSAADHTAKIYSRNDSSYLYFLVRCDDSDMRYSNPVASNYANDCVEFYIDPANDGGSTAISNSTSDLQLVIDADNQKNVYECTSGYATQLLNGITSAVVRDGTGWWLEARISKTAIDPDIATGDTIGLDFNFRDNDNNNDAALTTVYTWNDGSYAGFPSKIPNNWADCFLDNYQTPYSGVISLPGTIQAENYDVGGNNISYYDNSAGNYGGQYRTDNVDIEATADTGGGYNVGWTAAGEWLEYAVNVTTSGDYSIKVRLAGGGTGSFRVKLDGNDITGAKGFTDTGGWQMWTSIIVPTRYMGTGQHVLQLYIEGGIPNINYIDVVANGTDAVSVDLGNPDINDGLNLVTGVGDGDTVAATRAGHNCRENQAADDVYMYFNVFDAYAYQGNNPDINITFDYYDIGTSTLGLDYDSSSSSYQHVTGPTLANTLTWKSYSFQVTNAYFGNRQNGGADFRLTGPTTEWSIDTVVVAAPPDTTPPGNVTGFTATPAEGQISLSWTNPGGDFAGTRVLFKTTGYSTGPTDGTLIYDSAGTSTTHTGLTGGTTYYYTAYAHDGIPNYASGAQASATPIVQTPYAGVIPIPGTIQAENYDVGGNNISYYDTTAGNFMSQYRSDDVDIETCSDTGGGYNIGYAVVGEWQEYTINVAATGDYSMKARVATTYSNVNFKVLIDGSDVTGLKSFANTGGWQTYTTIIVPARYLTAGQHVLRFNFETGDFNVNYIDIVSNGADAVSCDLGSTDDLNGMNHLQVVDGDTTPATIGGHYCRQNVNAAEDYYMYFSVADAYSYQGNNPNLAITIDYYDIGTSQLSLQYDSTSSSYQVIAGPTLTNTLTWKSYTWTVNNAYFGNRQNAGADFRIADIGPTFYIDTVTVYPNVADTTPPGNVTGFTATSGDTQNSLSWTNPTDPDFTGTKIMFKTTGYPTSATDGTQVYDSNGTSTSHTGLTNGVTYYYGAYAHDAVPNYASGAQASAIPADVTAPGNVTSFVATSGDTQNSLSWTNPTDPDFTGVKIMFKTTGYPTSATDGTQVYDSNGTSTNHTGLTNGTTYYYKAFAHDAVPNYASGAQASAVPADVTAPGNVTSFVATSGDTQNSLSWTNPTGDFTGTKIMFKTTGYPTGPTDGTQVYDSNGTSTNHTGLTNGVTYYYKAFAHDEVPNYASGAQASAIPADVTAPGNVTSFTATSGDMQNSLSWTNPTDGDFAGTKVMFKTTGYPTGPTDGTQVYDSNGTSTNHTGLTNGVTYYYKAFAHDEVPNYASGAQASAVPADVTAPGNVTSFTATSGDMQNSLSWTNPGDSDLAGVKVMFKTTGYPTSQSDGTQVYNGTGTSTTHTSLTNGTTYYYKAFPYDEVPNYASGAQASATPADVTAPGNVTVFTATSGDMQNSLSWTNPGGDFTGTKIMFKTTGYPTGPTDGTQVYDSNGTSTNHTGLTNGVTYYYKAFAHDEVPNYASGAQASAVPADVTAPGPVTGFTATPGNQQVGLSWTNPGGDFTGTKILFKTTGYPANATDGTSIYDSSGTSTTHTGLTNGVTYYYKAFAHDEVPNYASGAQASAVPTDATAPTFGGSISPSTTDTLTPTTTITAQDTGSGLNVSSAEFAYSVDGGASFGTYIGRYVLHSIGTGSGGGNQYWYPDFYHPSYVIASGDHLQYDIYSKNTNGTGSVDLEGTFGNLRDSGILDQNGLSGHPGTNLYSRDYQQWYHRDFDLSSKAGQTITDYEMGHETDNGVSEFYVRNVIITNNGLVKDKAANADAWTSVSDTIGPGNNGFSSTVGPEMITGDPASPAACTGSNGTTASQNVTAVFSSTGMSPLVTGGTNRIKYHISDMSGNRATSSTFTITVDNQAPYSGVIALPGTIQAENFDNGGQNVAYYDASSGNTGGAYRTTDVDVETTGDTGGGYNVGWIDTGEWLEYTVNVASAGTYNLSMRTASPNAGCSVHIEMNGSNVTGTRTLPNTGAWQTYATTTFSGISLNAGQQIMRVYVEAGGFNFNYLDVTTGAITISNSTFDANADGWSINLWTTGGGAAASMAYNSGAGSSGGGIRCIGGGITDNADKCYREGGELYKTISTASRTGIKVYYDLHVNSLGGNYTGAGTGGSCVPDHSLVDEQLTVYYSTNGGTNWTEVENIQRAALLASYQTYGSRTIDLSAITACNNNSNFALKFRWQLNSDTDTADLDNLKVTGN